MAAEQPARRPTVHFQLPPCEQSFILHYRDGVPISLLIDNKPYTITPRRRGYGVRDGDKLLAVVEMHPNG